MTDGPTEERVAQILDETDWPAHREQRLEMGDLFDVVRPVDHAAMFGRRADADAAAAELFRRGFVVETRRRLLRVHVEATRPERISDVAEFVPEIVELVEAHGGVYDGWGAMVVDGETPAE